MRLSILAPLALVIATSIPASLAIDGFSILHLNNANSYCLILPKTKMTIGASEGGPGMAGSFCIDPKKEGQRQFPQGVWKNNGPHVTTGHGAGDYIQLTGTFNAYQVPTVEPHDADGGGQYDSNGGEGGRGNPAGSKCHGYASYVEIIEPNGEDSLACLRCCKDTADCPVNMDTAGCRKVIPGEY